MTPTFTGTRWSANFALTPSDAERLSNVFVDDPGRHADVLASLAETLEGHGDLQTGAAASPRPPSEGSTGDAWADPTAVVLSAGQRASLFDLVIQMT